MTYKNQEKMEPHKLDEFGLLDYKKPLGKQQDMRTATDFGHKFLTDTMLGNNTQVTFEETKSYVLAPVLERHRTSIYKADYVWKFTDPDEVRNSALDRSISFMKPFYECNLKFVARTMRPTNSITHSDFLWSPEGPISKPEYPSMPTPVGNTKVTISPNKPGYAKYLDTSATTSRLDYCYRSPTDIMNGIGAKDNITLWNWKNMERRAKRVFHERDIQMCDKLPSNECIKRRCEFTTDLKHVPNSGLSTEIRENYLPPQDRAIRYDMDHIRNCLTFVTLEPVKEKTEYGVLGSGDRPQKFI